MATFVNTFNLFLFFVFSLCYMYQMVYAVIVLVHDHKRKEELPEPDKLNRFACLIAGRNERLVIGELVKSIKAQDYPEELIDIYVIADNCTDDTADVAREAGAIVFERNDKLVVGKSHALDYALNRIRINQENDSSQKPYDAFFVFDADNVLDSGFIAAMNRQFATGDRVLTSYRNSKNYDSNWISAGSALWFLREAKFLSNARNIINSSCAISGTGFMIDADILRENGGWIHHLLTEDIEFSTNCIIDGIRIGYCKDAIIYDEQPTTFKDSWSQRMRWAKGFYQILLKYGRGLLHGIFDRNRKGSYACYDMFMTIAPAMLLTLAGVFVNLAFCAVGIIQLSTLAGSVQDVANIGSSASLQAAASDVNFFSSAFSLMTGSAFQGDGLSGIDTSNVATMIAYAEARGTIVTSFLSFMSCFVSFGLIMFLFGLLTTITEWKSIHASAGAKIKYLFTFPFFMLTYVPIALIAVFKKVKWTPITHNVVRSVSDVVNKG